MMAGCPVDASRTVRVPRGRAAYGSPRPFLRRRTSPPESPTDLLVALIRTLRNTHGRQPVVLVDEYDAPITEHLGTEADPAPAVNELRRFFRVLKDDEGLLYGVFVTGITRFVRHHLLAAANNFIDISDEPAYGALCAKSGTGATGANTWMPTAR